MTSDYKKLAEEILTGLPIMYGAKDGVHGKELLIEAMHKYLEVKLKEITDADIEVWASGKVGHMQDESYIIMAGYSGMIRGAKAMRDYEIKHIEE